jgi:hypothetical protein
VAVFPSEAAAVPRPPLHRLASDVV